MSEKNEWIYEKSFWLILQKRYLKTKIKAVIIKCSKELIRHENRGGTKNVNVKADRAQGKKITRV